MTKAIIACEKNGGIGFDGTMPWPKDDRDLARFKELTLNKSILMGRKTWEAPGMPKPLPNRTNIVVSTQDLAVPDGVRHVKSIGELKSEEVDWCIGGGYLIDFLFNDIHEFHLSHLHEEYECDTFIDLDKLHNEFYCVRSQLCMTHHYEIWRRK